MSIAWAVTNVTARFLFHLFIHEHIHTHTSTCIYLVALTLESIKHAVVGDYFEINVKSLLTTQIHWSVACKLKCEQLKKQQPAASSIRCFQHLTAWRLTTCMDSGATNAQRFWLYLYIYIYIGPMHWIRYRCLSMTYMYAPV